ncbi:hypothetical protein BgiMline_035357, partial [Biomphalaria glabrata]
MYNRAGLSPAHKYDFQRRPEDSLAMHRSVNRGSAIKFGLTPFPIPVRTVASSLRAKVVGPN